jgi:Kef-type K+ transport system membrane component KefB
VNEDLILLLVLPLVAASIMGLIARSLGLSIIAGYIVGGVIVGPVLHLVDPASPILSFLSELGVILIAFEIGLTVKMDFLSRGGFRSGGIVAVEILFVSLVSFLLGSALRLQWGDILVFIFMAVNTSTAVTFKMMEERGVDEQNVRTMILGVGAFEDIVAIVGLSIFPVLAAVDSSSPLTIIRLIASILMAVILMVYIGLRVLANTLEWVAQRESEIFLATSLSIVLIYAYVGLLSGLSTALGAFVAGLVVSNLKVSEIVSEKLHSLRDLSTLIFFSSIGASLPVIKDPLLLTLSIIAALVVVLVKFFGFSLSSWVMGMPMVSSYQLGLYMLAISEFGVILAKNAAEEGLASPTLYTVSVIALAASAILSSVMIKFENQIPARMTALFPEQMRLRLENIFEISRNAMDKEATALYEIRTVLWNLLKRITAILFVEGIANIILTYLTPLLLPAIRLPAELLTVGFTVIVVVFLTLRVRGLIAKLVQGIMKNMQKTQIGINDVLVSFLYVVTLSVVLIFGLGMSYPLLQRNFDYIFGELGSGLLVVGLILLILFLTWRRALRACLRLEETFKLS